MLRLIVTWFLNALALFVLPYIVPTIHVAGYRSALVAALVLGFVNTLIRPVLVLLTLPVTLLTLGLFLLVINALMLLLTSWVATRIGVGWYVDGFGTALLGSIIVSVVSFVLNTFLPDRNQPPRRLRGTRA